MSSRLIGVFIEHEWVAVSYHAILTGIRFAGHEPVLITTNREWEEGIRTSIPLGPQEEIETLQADLSINEVEIDDYAGFVFGGGYWVDRLRWWFMKEKEPGVLERPEPRQLVEQIVTQPDLIVGVICHAMWLLCSLRQHVTPRQVTCAYNIIDDVRNAGFDYVDSDVVVDGNLVSGRMSDMSELFIREFLELVDGGNR